MAVTGRMVAARTKELESIVGEMESLLSKIGDIRGLLESYRDTKQELLDNEESADSPNDERVSELSEQIQCFESAIGSLEDLDSLENTIETVRNTVDELGNYL